MILVKRIHFTMRMPGRGLFGNMDNPRRPVAKPAPTSKDTRLTGKMTGSKRLYLGGRLGFCARRQEGRAELKGASRVPSGDVARTVRMAEGAIEKGYRGWGTGSRGFTVGFFCRTSAVRTHFFTKVLFFQVVDAANEGFTSEKCLRSA